MEKEEGRQEGKGNKEQRVMADKKEKKRGHDSTSERM